MKSILLYANEDQGFDARLQAALDLAARFGGHLTCLQVTPFDAFIMGDPFGGVYAMTSVMGEIAKAEEAHRVRVEARLAREGGGWDWLHYDGAPAQILVDRARLSDVVVMSLPGESDPRDRARGLLADAVLHARAPLLAVPPEGHGMDAGGAAMIAWDGTREASQALRATLPMLAAAAAVHVVTVVDDRTEFPATDACLYLSRHGLEAQLHEWPRDGRSTAAALLDAAATLRAAYVAMGAYGHSRLREAVLGGATRDMIHGARLPLLLAH